MTSQISQFLDIKEIKGIREELLITVCHLLLLEINFVSWFSFYIISVFILSNYTVIANVFFFAYCNGIKSLDITFYFQ